MDAPRGMTGPEADAALRDLFRAAGPLPAPKDLEARALGRIAAGAPAPIPAERPLLPRWAWAVGLAFPVAAWLIGTRGSAVPAWMEHWNMPARTGQLFTSPWLLLGVAGGTLLLALHVWLDRRLFTTFR